MKPSPTGLKATTLHGQKSFMLRKSMILAVLRRQVPGESGTQKQKDAILRFKLPVRNPMQSLQVLQVIITKVLVKMEQLFCQTELLPLLCLVFLKPPAHPLMSDFPQEASLA